MGKNVMVCNLCKIVVAGDPLRHLVEKHDPLQLFTPVPVITWEELGVKMEPKKE
jgi:hypothetical protein